MLTHYAFMQFVLEAQEFLFLGFEQLGDRDSRPLRNDFADLFFGDVVAQQLTRGEGSVICAGQQLLQLRHSSVLEL